ncbi:MAG: hypothetical protein ABI653_08550, partial [Bacteroidota bacterium]
MERKKFIRSLALAGAAFQVFPKNTFAQKQEKKAHNQFQNKDRLSRIPQYLKVGNTMGFTAPAGF